MPLPKRTVYPYLQWSSHPLPHSEAVKALPESRLNNSFLVGTWDPMSHPVGHGLWMMTSYWTFVPSSLKFPCHLRHLHHFMGARGRKGQGTPSTPQHEQYQTGKDWWDSIADPTVSTGWGEGGESAQALKV